MTSLPTKTLAKIMIISTDKILREITLSLRFGITLVILVFLLIRVVEVWQQDPLFDTWSEIIDITPQDD
ncbi:hypothetical protein XM38_000110 [Halomicronema hongdechloris C2206]|uniref:Uncharacterized protein n=2 Tax=Halomicronema hongdechloris TaxID=1209493 RepID=A0A1Z3HFM9_9CYAN|nr:hypothetical protein XM38_000110 [Halomicronema hongdechloris C2206]